MAERIYITTPIYYVNDKPHIGHAYTTTVCDVYARFMRFAGNEVFFLTGTDEHGVKVEKSAREKGISPEQLADANAAEFKSVLGMFGLTNDDFIRTTEDRHINQVKQVVRRLIDAGDVYRGEYEGWYDEGQEEFIPEGRAKEQAYKSTISGRSLVRMKEANYFFRLSAYRDRLQQWYEAHPGFVRPEARRNEMLARLREGLNDVPVSRTSFSWGVPVPGDEDHVLWVWLDALMNYITAIGVVDPSCVEHPERAAFWPADYHVIGKEILFFHALFWPAVLMALDLPLPKCVYAHSFWISEGQKMSKSLGNFVDLPAIRSYLDTYSLDAWRYYMATQGPLGSQDADFAADHFHEVYNSHLVNTVGNCTSRVTAMINRYFDGALPESADLHSVIDQWNWKEKCERLAAESFDRMAELELSGAIGAAIQLVREVDGFINATEPFKIAKDDSQRDRLAAILAQCAEALRIASCLLWCVMPEAMAEFWRAMSLDIDPARGDLREQVRFGGGRPLTSVRKVALFPRVERSSG